MPKPDAPTPEDSFDSLEDFHPTSSSLPKDVLAAGKETPLERVLTESTKGTKTPVATDTESDNDYDAEVNRTLRPVLNEYFAPVHQNLQDVKSAVLYLSQQLAANGAMSPQALPPSAEDHSGPLPDLPEGAADADHDPVDRGADTSDLDTDEQKKDEAAEDSKEPGGAGGDDTADESKDDGDEGSKGEAKAAPKGKAEAKGDSKSDDGRAKKLSAKQKAAAEKAAKAGQSEQGLGSFLMTPLRRLAAPSFDEPDFEHEYWNLRKRVRWYEERMALCEQHRAEAEKRGSDATEKLLEARREIKRLQGKEEMFRGIILDKAESHKVSDDELISKFLSIRQSIQQIIYSRTCKYDGTPNVPEDADEGMVSFYSLWDENVGLSRKDFMYRVMSQIFLFIYTEILNARTFGLEGEGRPEASEIEHGLARFESVISRHIKEDAVGQWRRATLACVDFLKISEGTSDRVANEILRFMSPLVIKDATEQQVTDLLKTIRKACREAFELRMMMRRARDNYRVDMPRTPREPSPTDGPGAATSILLSRWGHMAEPLYVEGGKHLQATDVIAYTICGALIKAPEANANDTRVLEKAHVTLFGE